MLVQDGWSHVVSVEYDKGRPDHLTAINTSPNKQDPGLSVYLELCDFTRLLCLRLGL